MTAMVDAIKWWDDDEDPRTFIDLVTSIPSANAKFYNRHEVAVLMAEVIGDDCACNVKNNDEWLPEYCEFSKTVCPNVCGVACWEQYLMAREKRREDNKRKVVIS